MKVIVTILLCIICLVIGGLVGSRIGYQNALEEHLEREYLWREVDSLHFLMVLQSEITLDTLLTLLGDDYSLSTEELDDFKSYAIQWKAEADKIVKYEKKLRKQFEKYE